MIKTLEMLRLKDKETFDTMSDSGKGSSIGGSSISSSIGGSSISSSLHYQRISTGTHLKKYQKFGITGSHTQIVKNRIPVGQMVAPDASISSNILYLQLNDIYSK